MAFVVKLTAEQVKEIKELLAQGVKQKVIAKQFGISQETVSNIKVGKIWQNI